MTHFKLEGFNWAWAFQTWNHGIPGSSPKFQLCSFSHQTDELSPETLADCCGVTSWSVLGPESGIFDFSIPAHTTFPSQDSTSLFLKGV